MSRSGPLSVAEKFYIDQQYKTMSQEDICKKLDRGKKQVAKYVKEHARINNPPNVAPSVKSTVGKSQGATVMTQAAQQIADEIPKGDITQTTRYKTRVFRPNKDKR